MPVPRARRPLTRSARLCPAQRFANARRGASSTTSFSPTTERALAMRRAAPLLVDCASSPPRAASTGCNTRLAQASAVRGHRGARARARARARSWEAPPAQQRHHCLWLSRPRRLSASRALGVNASAGAGATTAPRRVAGGCEHPAVKCGRDGGAVWLLLSGGLRDCRVMRCGDEMTNEDL